MNRVLIIDHKDSFSYILLDYLIQLGWDPILKQSEEFVSKDIKEVEWMLISPGFGDPSSKTTTLQIVDECLGKLPILGICLGHQLLAFHQGGVLKKSEQPLHGIVSKLLTEHAILPRHWAFSEIMHYHSWVIKDMPFDAEVLAKSDRNGDIMGMMNLNKKYLSWQFHPESICTELGMEILDWSIGLLLKE